MHEHRPGAAGAAFTMPACGACGALDAGGRESCAGCGGTLAPRPVSGRGTLLAWTLIRRPPAGFDAEGPYAVALIALDEGVRLTARLAAHEPQPPAGARVRLARDAGGAAIAQLESPR